MKAEKDSTLFFFKLIASPYVLDILRQLDKSLKRFSELKKVCRNERTLSKKLDYPIGEGVVKTTALKYGLPVYEMFLEYMKRRA